MTSIITRRSLICGLFAAPAIVAINNIMPVKLWKPQPVRIVAANWEAQLIDTVDIHELGGWKPGDRLVFSSSYGAMPEGLGGEYVIIHVSATHMTVLERMKQISEAITNGSVKLT